MRLYRAWLCDRGTIGWRKRFTQAKEDVEKDSQVGDQDNRFEKSKGSSNDKSFENGDG